MSSARLGWVLGLATLVATLLGTALTGGCRALPGGGGAAAEATAGEDSSLHVYEDGTARLEGQVVENARMCEMDAACWLVFRVDGEPYEVIYEAEEGGSCLNRSAADAGYAAEPGERLEVYGKHEPAPRGGTISTCPEERFYIRPAV